MARFSSRQQMSAMIGKEAAMILGNDSDSSIDDNPVAGGGGSTCGFFEISQAAPETNTNHFTSHDFKQQRKARNHKSTHDLRRNTSQTPRLTSPAPPQNTEKFSISMHVEDDSVPVNLVAPVGFNDADNFYQRSSARDVRQQHQQPRNDSQSATLITARFNPLKQMIAEKTNGTTLLQPEDENLSPWLTNEIDHLQEKYRNKSLLCKNAQTDTYELDKFRDMEIRRLQEKIEDLECDNKVKDRELETNRWIEKEMERKLKNAEDVYQLKMMLKEKERQLEIQHRINRDVTHENMILAEDVAEKQRQILQLQSEVDNLDRVIAAKNALRDDITIAQLMDQLENVQNELAKTEMEFRKLEKEQFQAKEHFSKKDRECLYKDEKVQELGQEVVELKQEIGSRERGRLVLEEQIKNLLKENEHLDEHRNKCNDLREQQLNLQDEMHREKDKVRNLESQVRHLEHVTTEKERLEHLVKDLQRGLQDKNEIDKQRKKIAQQLLHTETLMKDRQIEEEAIRIELEQIKNYTKELEKENGFYRDLEKDYLTVKCKYDEMERQSQNYERQLNQLKPQIKRLQSKSQEKDELINRLANELRTSTDFLPSTLLADVDSMNTHDNGLLEEVASVAKPSLARNQHLRPDLLVDSGTPSSPVVKQNQKSSKVNHPQQHLIAGRMSPDEASSIVSLSPGAILPSTMIGPNWSVKTDSKLTCPAAPSRLQIQRVLGDNSVVLEWLPPPLDDLDRNNGIQICGYKIFVNHVEVQRVGSPRLNKALVNKVLLNKSTRLGIQSFSDAGVNSEMIEIPVARHYLTNAI